MSRLMTLLQEMDIVKKFEDKERELTGILEKRLKEKRRFQNKVSHNDVADILMTNNSNNCCIAS